MTVRRKLLLLVYVPVLVATILAVIVSSFKMKKQGISGLEDKSASILSLSIQEYIKHHQDGSSIFEEENGKKTDSVNYKFRISSLDPESPSHAATEKDKIFIDRFQKEKNQQITYIDKESDSLLVMRPVFMDKAQGCMECHAVTKSGRHANEGELRGIFIVSSSMADTQSKVKSAITDISIIGIITIVIAVLLGISLILKVISALSQIVKVSKKVSEGDLQQKVNINTGDELEELGNHINNMVDSLNNVIVNVKNAVNGFALSTSEIASTAGKISQGAQEQTDHFEELVKTAHMAMQTAHKADEIIRISVDKARIAGSGMSQTIHSMEKIRESSVKISQAVKIINSISFQTNILALNAAVEASQAGIHGKGFSVISSEVKKLSEITSKSSGDINTITENNLSQVENGMNIAQDADKTLADIINMVNQINNLLKEITAVNEMHSKIMEGNREITNSNVAASKVLSASVSDLDAQANKLSEIVRYFKL